MLSARHTLPALLACSFTACGGTATDPGQTADPVLGAPGDPSEPGATPGSLTWKSIQRCPVNGPMDPISISDVGLEGSTLMVDANHGGGCEKHEYALCYANEWQESEPVQVDLKLLHDANGDGCEALLGVELDFDLTPLEEEYETRYRTEGGRISLSLGDMQLTHVFGGVAQDVATWDEINTRIDELNTCEVVDDCVALSTSPCSDTYVNKDAETSDVRASIEERNALDGNGGPIFCTDDCACGTLACEEGQCVKKRSGCEEVQEGEKNICY